LNVAYSANHSAGPRDRGAKIRLSKPSGGKAFDSLPRDTTVSPEEVDR